MDAAIFVRLFHLTARITFIKLLVSSLYNKTLNSDYLMNQSSSVPEGGLFKWSLH